VGLEAVERLSGLGELAEEVRAHAGGRGGIGLVARQGFAEQDGAVHALLGHEMPALIDHGHIHRHLEGPGLLRGRVDKAQGELER